MQDFVHQQCEKKVALSFEGIRDFLAGAQGRRIASTEAQHPTVNPIKLETGSRPNSAGIPYTLLLRVGAAGFPTFGLLL